MVYLLEYLYILMTSHYWHRILASMVLMLEKCESFALTHDILFNASKTKYMIFKRYESVNMVPLYF